ncbi:MAG: oxidoreductase [Candidatus Izemoplasma sp.]
MKKSNWKIEDINDLSGKYIIVTGANSGIGFEASKVLASKGAKIIMGVRSIERGIKAKEDILSVFPNSDIDVLKLDLMDSVSIKRFADKYLTKYNKIDILLNNAGIMTVPYGRTKDGFEQQIGVNHLGHFALTGLLLDMLKKSKSRIVNVASIAHRYGKINTNSFIYQEGNKYNKAKAYSQSKLANLLFTYKLSRMLQDEGKDMVVVAAHPGVSRTNLGRHIDGSRIMRLSNPIVSLLDQDQEAGALSLIMACTDLDAKTGTYYGPDGFFTTKGNPFVTKSNKLSHNHELQDHLFSVSEELTKVKY